MNVYQARPLLLYASTILKLSDLDTFGMCRIFIPLKELLRGMLIRKSSQ